MKKSIDLNKWVYGALPALLIHCSIGSVYAWSLFVTPISEHIQKSRSLVQFAFSLAIFFLGMSAAFFGSTVERNVKKSAHISCRCFVSGLCLTSIGITFKSLILIYLGYGCLMGIGLGVGYLTPIKTLMMWFKDNKGLATGIAITGFGFASTIASPIITFLLNHFSLQLSFVILAIIYFIPLLIASMLIRKPEKDQEDKNKFKYKTVLKDKTFIKIWLVMFINITCGLALISIASPLLNELNINPMYITIIVSIMGIFNGFGRLILATLSDKCNKRITIYNNILCVSLFLTLAISMLYLYNGISNTFIVFIFSSLLIISATYGAGFSCLPALLSDIYGMKNISKIHGLCLTSWAFAGLCGNQLSELIRNITGEYFVVYIALAVLYMIALIISQSIKNK